MTKKNAGSLIRDLKRRTNKQYGSEEKIRIVIEGMRGEVTVAELCRQMEIPDKVTPVFRFKVTP